MSTLFLLLSAMVQAAEGDEGCEEDWADVDMPGAHYVPTVGCLVDDISAYCDDFGADCQSWDQVLARYKDSPPDVKDSVLLVCADGSDYAYRYDRSRPDWGTESYYYFDEDGFLSGYDLVVSWEPYCCDGFQTWRIFVGDPYATCIEPTDTGSADTADTSKTGPCGCATDTGAAAALIAACTLLTVRRRRQP